MCIVYNIFSTLPRRPFHSTRTLEENRPYVNVKFCVRLGVNQGAVLSSLFFVILLKAFSMVFHTDCSLQLLHADDLMIFTMEALLVMVEKLKLFIFY